MVQQSPWLERLLTDAPAQLTQSAQLQSAELPAGKANRSGRLRAGTVQGGITALSEALFSEGGQQEVGVGHTFWSGRPKAERRDAGVAFVIRNDTVGRLPCLPQSISDRLMTLACFFGLPDSPPPSTPVLPPMTNSDDVRIKSCEALHVHLATVS
nr:unnamed protein product [Spirometra erinaceieuropaei]